MKPPVERHPGPQEGTTFMEPAEREKAALIADIEADALKEAEAIVRDAQTRVAEKKKYADKQIESLLAEARNKAREQAEAIRKQAASAAELEVKRRFMRLRTQVVEDVLAQVEEKLAARIGDGDYRSVLVDWIAEAAIGLGVESAEVNASQKERALIDDRLLQEVGEKVRTETGKAVTLTLPAAQPLTSQGVILTAADGRTAFNNQVKTRMLRNQRRIRALIHDALFADNREE